MRHTFTAAAAALAAVAMAFLLLPVVAIFYLAATLGAAWSHHFGRGVAWKGRAYAAGRA